MRTPGRNVLLLILTLLSCLSSQSLGQEAGCSSDDDCNLNGLCIESACVCDEGWRASDCGELDTRAADRKTGYNKTGQGISSWGARIIHDPQDPELFHLIASEFPGGCGLEHWAPFSRIIRAESRSGAAGPYEFADEILGAFAHNPTVVYSPQDDLYLLYYIGCPVVLPGSCGHMNFTCGRGNDRNGESGISLLTSRDLRLWTAVGEIFSGAEDAGAWDATVTNPSALVLENPSSSPSAATDPAILLAYRGCPYNCSPPVELLNLATTTIPTSSSSSSVHSYSDPYERMQSAPLFPASQNEDPFLWRDKRGHYHMLMHSLEVHGGFGDGPNVGRHAYARSWSGPWTLNDRTLAYSTAVDFSDGSRVEYFRRERPQLFFSDDDEGGGGAMTPLYLVTGVNEKGTDQSYTLVVPIGEQAVGYERRFGEEVKTGGRVRDEL